MYATQARGIRSTYYYEYYYYIHTYIFFIVVCYEVFVLPITYSQSFDTVTTFLVDIKKPFLLPNTMTFSFFFA